MGCGASQVRQCPKYWTTSAKAVLPVPEPKTVELVAEPLVPTPLHEDRAVQTVKSFMFGTNDSDFTVSHPSCSKSLEDKCTQTSEASRISAEDVVKGPTTNRPSLLQLPDMSKTLSLEMDRFNQPTTDGGGENPVLYLEYGNRGSEDTAAVSSDDDASENDSESEKPPTLRRPRGNAISAETFGARNPRRNIKPATVFKPLDYVVTLEEAFHSCPLTAKMQLDDLRSVIEVIPIITIPASQQIIRQGDLGDALFVVLEGQVDCYVRRGEKGYETFVTRLSIGDFFGELSILWSAPNSVSVYAAEGAPCVLGQLSRDLYQGLVVCREMDNDECRRQYLRNMPFFDMMDDEDLAKLEEALDSRVYEHGEIIIKQGDKGNALFLIESGEARVILQSQKDGSSRGTIFEVKRYHAGGVFGERALITGEPRAATVVADGRVEALYLKRHKFERLFGPLNQLKAAQYVRDPRACIANFYKDLSGKQKGEAWFAVYRPCSRDAISKMLSSVAVGKGLNVKGKSAKRGVLSGFVPFVQIHVNEHKNKIEESPSDSRVTIYYKTPAARNEALFILQSILNDADLDIDHDVLLDVDSYAPQVFGLDIPEPLLREAYIMRQDITPVVGWETGRVSEPAFMDMNLHAVRGLSDPVVALLQFDENNPMNPHGLLIAYAEQSVKPVVSDFDTFLVGSKGMEYLPLPNDQVELAKWSLHHTRMILEQPWKGSWTSRWISVIKGEAEKGFAPEIPKYGFGDPTSYGLVKDVIESTIACGAVRHGAECFNYYFPQELDDEYLVIWSGFQDHPWEYLSEDQLRTFLCTRANEGFVFPLNPVWPARDLGWFQVFEALERSATAQQALEAWFPQHSGIRDTIAQLHAANPSGFSEQKCDHERATSVDVEASERADMVLNEVSKLTKWSNARARIRASMMVQGSAKKSLFSKLRAIPQAFPSPSDSNGLSGEFSDDMEAEECD
eukprot:TRINITY_DN45825_c0_g1_i1.p1 TRINITY_DN45825_c0_g1~~TRINITY_DN45825_c0_g1_i1.p1  ORF type:complete len:962 (+),score=132.66 TRINITY_DN45825_c0_g1_i1:67-2952(+)